MEKQSYREGQEEVEVRIERLEREERWRRC
jgi:hypothetical protein